MGPPVDPTSARRPGTSRPPAGAPRIEGRTPQRVDPEVPLGHGGFADDTAPVRALVAVPDGAGGWAVGESVAEARAAAGKVQGRRTTAELRHPFERPPGDWEVTLRTTWVEPAYLELDASWCVPGGEPASPLANGGAFGGKQATVVTRAARDLADRARPSGPGAPRPRGRRAAGRQAPADRRRHPAGRVRGHPRGADGRDRRGGRIRGARPGRRAGRRPRPADVVGAAGHRVGGGAGRPRRRGRPGRRLGAGRPASSRPSVPATGPASASALRRAQSPTPMSSSGRSPGSTWP